MNCLVLLNASIPSYRTHQDTINKEKKNNSITLYNQ